MPINTSPETLLRAKDHYNLDITTKIKFVGLIYISLDSDSLMYESNFDPPTEDFNRLLNKIFQRNISTVGAGIMFNSKLISKFTHILVNLNLDNEQAKNLNKLGIDFCTRANKRHLVKKAEPTFHFIMAALTSVILK